MDSTRAIKALACPSSTLCVAVDASGYAVTYNGSAWATPVDADGARALDALSCPSTSFCSAADTTGYATSYNSTSWSTPTDMDASRSVSSVSCTSSTFCMAVDTSGYAATYATGSSSSAQLTWDLTSTLPNILSDGGVDYLYGPDGTPIEEIVLSTSTPTYLSYVASDATWVSTNEAGDLTGLWSYDAFGTLATSTLSNGTPTSAFGYGGQYTDATTGFGVNRARYYDPAVGTFVTRDPAFRSTDTAYAYAGDDPVNESDPTGLSIIGDLGNWLVGDPRNWATDTVPGTYNGLNTAGTGMYNGLEYSGAFLWNTAYALAGQPGPYCGIWGAAGLANVIDFVPGVAALLMGDDTFGGAGLNGAITDETLLTEQETETSNLLSGLASKAQTTVGEGSGPVYGTAVHTEFATEIKALGDPALSSEISYVGGRVMNYGTPGSVRLDVVEGSLQKPTVVYDLKTGSATLSQSRIAQIRANLPDASRDIPIIVIRP